MNPNIPPEDGAEQVAAHSLDKMDIAMNNQLATTTPIHKVTFIYLSGKRPGLSLLIDDNEELCEKDT